jgi:anti-anti-sigma regulatory factor
MMMVSSSSEKITLNENLDMQGCSAMHATFLDVQPGVTIQLDGSKVERIGTVGIQLMLSLAKHRSVHFAGISEELREAFEVSGLSQWLAQWEQ